MSSKRLDDVGDFRRHGYNLRIDCKQCGWVAVLDPTELVLLCNRRQWSRQIGSVEAISVFEVRREERPMRTGVFRYQMTVRDALADKRPFWGGFETVRLSA